MRVIREAFLAEVAALGWYLLPQEQHSCPGDNSRVAALELLSCWRKLPSGVREYHLGPWPHHCDPLSCQTHPRTTCGLDASAGPGDRALAVPAAAAGDTMLHWVPRKLPGGLPWESCLAGLAAALQGSENLVSHKTLTPRIHFKGVQGKRQIGNHTFGKLRN